MGSRYKFSEEEIKAIEQKRKANKEKRAEARLKALEMRGQGSKCERGSRSDRISCSLCDTACGKISKIWT